MPIPFVAKVMNRIWQLLLGIDQSSPGAATGKVVFSADEAQEWASRGDHVILVRRETTPDDYHGMIASQGILTSAGGTNSHAAVVARGEGIPAVCGADAIHLDPASRSFSADGVAVKEGDVITIDGFTGRGIVSLVVDQSKLGLMNIIVDLYRGLGVLAKDPRIDPGRIAVMGFSRGGLITLYSAMKRFQTAWNESGVCPATTD